MLEVRQSLDLVFNPGSVAFVGASNNPAKWGFRIFLNLIKGGFQGRIYPGMRIFQARQWTAFLVSISPLQGM